MERLSRNLGSSGFRILLNPKKTRRKGRVDAMSKWRCLALLLVLLLIGFVTLTGCAPEEVTEDPNDEDPDAVEPEPDPIPEERGTLVYAERGDPVWLNPLREGAGSDFRVNSLLFDCLFVQDWDYNPHPQLATDFEVSDDGKEVIVNLVTNAKWHDGVPLTAADVVFTYQQFLNPVVPSRYTSDLWAVRGFGEMTETETREDFEGVFEEHQPVVALDDYTVQFNLDQPFAGFVMNALILRIAPKHLLEEDIDDIEASPFNRNPVGSGPFKFVEWDAESEMIFEAFDDYYQGAPGVERAIRRVVPDPAVASIEMRAGNIHHFAPVRLEVVEEYLGDPNYHTMVEPGLGYHTLAFVNDIAPWDDIRVRQAMAYGLNTKEAVERYVGVMGTHANMSPLTDQHWAHNPNLEPYPYDPDKALELLGEAGWEMGPDDVLVKDGQRFEFLLETFPGVERHDMNIIFQEDLRKIGINAEPREVAAPELIYKMHQAEDEDVTFIGWGFSVDPDGEFTRRWHSSELDWNNFYNYSNPQVDELLDMARVEMDQDARRDLYWEVQEILHEEVPGVFVTWTASPHVFSGNVGGMVQDGEWMIDTRSWLNSIHLLTIEP